MSILRLGAPTAVTTAWASAWVETKKPGMSRVLMASVSRVMPCGASLPAAYLRLAMSVARQAAGSAAGGRDPGHGVRRRVPRRVA